MYKKYQLVYSSVHKQPSAGPEDLEQLSQTNVTATVPFHVNHYSIHLFECEQLHPNDSNGF